MLDRNAFMETLRAVAELTRTAQNGLSKEEILKYFEGMELSEEHVEMIYQYLQLPPEVQTGEPEAEEESQPEVEEEEPTEFWALGADEYIEYMDMAEVEWMKFHPVFVLREYQGLLVEPKTVVMNYEKELREVLEKYHIPFEYDESNKIYTVYGYR